MKNTHILMDYDNIYITLDKNYVRYDHPNLRSDIVSELKKKYSEELICETKLFLDFKTISLTDSEFEFFKNNHVKLEHVYSGKNASDIYLMLEIMKTIADDEAVDKFIIASSDSDMLPIINELKRRRKEVVVIYFEMNTDEEYIKYLETIADESFSIEELLKLNKYKDTDFEYFNNNIDIILEKINIDIIKVFNNFDRYNPKIGRKIKCGTYGKKDIRNLMEETRIVVRYDISAIIEKLFEIGALYESDSLDKNSSYKKVLINPEFLTNKEIQLDGLITEDNYKDWVWKHGESMKED